MGKKVIYRTCSRSWICQIVRMGSKEDVQPKEKSSDGKLYRVQVEAFAERGNGERLAEELKKKKDIRQSLSNNKKDLLIEYMVVCSEYRIEISGILTLRVS